MATQNSCTRTQATWKESKIGGRWWWGRRRRWWWWWCRWIDSISFHLRNVDSIASIKVIDPASDTFARHFDKWNRKTRNCQRKIRTEPKMKRNEMKSQNKKLNKKHPAAFGDRACECRDCGMGRRMAGLMWLQEQSERERKTFGISIEHLAVTAGCSVTAFLLQLRNVAIRIPIYI